MSHSGVSGPGPAVHAFFNSLAIGGTEKAACAWLALLKQRGRRVMAVPLQDGPRRADLVRAGVPRWDFGTDGRPGKEAVAEALADAGVVHAHVPGYPHRGDILGEVFRHLGRKIPVVQTNVFGRLDNPAEDAWTDFRLFISWTSCVQAARRKGLRLDLDYFRRRSVAVYPIEPLPEEERVRLCGDSLALRRDLGLEPGEVLFGRFSRPEPNKWSPVLLKAFLAARGRNSRLRLLLQEPPPAVAAALVSEGLAEPVSAGCRHGKCPVLMLPATADPGLLSVSQMACDAILHISSMGESFGYGIAEPMALGKAVVTNSVPWVDQAQIELVRHGECGRIASTGASMTTALLELASDPAALVEMGRRARAHVLSVADPIASTDRLETAFQCAVEGRDNPHAEEDLEKALETSRYLDAQQWGHSFGESAHLRWTDGKIRFLRWQKLLRQRVLGGGDKSG